MGLKITIIRAKNNNSKYKKLIKLITMPGYCLLAVMRGCVFFKINDIMEIFKIDNELLSKLNGIKNECSDYLENLRNRKTIILNLNDETDKSAMDFRDWKIKNYKEMIKKSEGKLFSNKIDLISQLEDLLKDLKKQ